MILNDLAACKVLIVDDTKINIDILVQALKFDYKLGVALNGTKAIEYASKNKPDLILLDILMPDMDGFEACRLIKSNPETRDIPVIFITAKDDDKSKTKGFKIGAVDYIVKPFDIKEVKARVKTHLMLKISKQALKNQNFILEEKVRQRTIELEQTQIDIINRLGKAAEYHDEETGNHIKRMAENCMLLAKAYGLTPREYKLIGLASTMHDVGKIGISDTILLKPGKLTKEEWNIMKTHTTIGANLLSGSKIPLLQMAEVIALTHHERWDGKGYPQGLKGKDIPIYGRMACICDVFDALISNRPYKHAWPVEKAIQEIESGKSTYFDPELTELFIENFHHDQIHYMIS